MDWTTVMAVAAESTVILGCLGTVFRFVVLKPLNVSIQTLQKTIEKMNKQEDAREEKRQEMDKRLVAVEESTKSAHKRIDEIVDGR